MIRYIAIFVAGASVGFIGSLIYAMFEMTRRIDP